MSTQPFKGILDRDRAAVTVRSLAGVTSPLLQEVVNHATNVFVRCHVEATAEEGVDLAPFILFRQITELTDAVEVLLASSCASPAIPLLRSSLEAGLGLEYILTGSEEEFRCRSLSWLCVYVHKRLGSYDIFGLDREVSQRKLKGTAGLKIKASDAKANLAKVLTRPYMVPVEQEYQRLSSRRREPAWYSLFEGPSNLRQLAKRLGQEKNYTHLYKYWSTFSHGGDASSGLLKSTQTSAAFHILRSPEMLLVYARLASLFQLRATRLMVERYRPGESLRQWFTEEVKPDLDTLKELQAEVDRVEWKDV
jgi:hypothetical protein